MFKDHKVFLSILFVFLLFACGGWIGYKHYFNLNEAKEITEEESEIPLRDRMDLAYAQEFELTKDLALNDIPRERLISAYEYAQQIRSQSDGNKIAGVLPGLNWVERGPSNFGGRTRAIMVDPNDATKKTVWSAGVGGGLWKTTDITQPSPAWAAVNDLFSNIAITTICCHPASTQIFYFGTGEGYSNADAIRGNGIWKTIDGGVTWNQLASSTGANFYYVNRMVVHPGGDVYAATRNGLFRSQDGGITWNRVLGTSAPGGASTDDFSDVEIASDNYIWTSTRANGEIFRSPNGNGGSWTKLNTGVNGFPTSGITRVDFALAPSNAAICYAYAAQSGVNFYKTTDFGATWTLLPKPVDADGGIGNDITRSQYWYDMSIAVDPNNPNSFFVGGVDLFKSPDGGATWQQISHWYGGFSFQDVHADQHIALFEPGNSNVIYFGNDGGIWRSSNATAAIPTIVSKHDNYNVTQFYACAMHPAAYSNYFLAGAQDNGSHQFTVGGIGPTTEVTGGDGCFVHIDQNQPQYQFTSYVYSNYYRSTNGGATFVGITSDNNGSFVNPSDYDDVANNFYACYGNGNYSRILNAPATNTITTIAVGAFNSGKVTHVGCSQNTANKVFFGLNNGRVVRVDNADQAVPIATHINNGAGMPGGSVSCIAIENGNDNHLLVTYSNYGSNSAWETINGGTTWTSVEGNLPDMPVRWALFNPTNNQQALLATEIGVWSTDLLNGGTTNWGPSNTGLANTRVDMLQIRSSDNIVAAATHGRGLFTSDVFATPHADFASDKRITYKNKTIQFTDASYKSTSWLWDFGDATTSTSKNPVKTYSTAGVYTVTLQINGSASFTSTKTAYIQILPDRGTPYTPIAGGNFDVSALDFGADNFAGTGWERGNSAIAGKSGTNSGANAWVSGLTATTYADNSDSRLMTPNYNFTAAGTYNVKLYRKNSCEIGYDGFRLEYSLDKGSTWYPIGTVTPAWYDFANGSGGTAFPVNEPFFNNTKSSFTLCQYDVSVLAGNANVAFRMRFKSDGSVNTAGVTVDDFEITGPNNNPLPVELISFTGEAKETYNLLEWQTSSEINNSGFDIEKSTDGALFEKAGFITGNGTAITTHQYFFKDKEITSAVGYYRLKQIDFNGQYKYSSIILIKRKDNDDFIKNIFPNPFHDHIVVEGNDANTKNVKVTLFDRTGKKVFEQLFSSLSEHLEINISRPDLSNGIYFICLQNEKFYMTRKLIKE